MLFGMRMHFNWYKLNLSIKNVAFCWLVLGPSLRDVYLLCHSIAGFSLAGSFIVKNPFLSLQHIGMRIWIFIGQAPHKIAS